MTERDIKLLWGRSGNRCASCKSELSHDKKLSSDKYPLGEQAHIVGEKDSAARGKSNLSDEERDGYSNRILLCPTHHTEIDRDVEFYSVERLHLIKQQHEMWVQERLSEKTDNQKQAQDFVYSTLVDAAIGACDFENWTNWTSWALSPSASWHHDAYDKIRTFRDLILRAAWPEKNPELEEALKTLAFSMFAAVDTFWLHANTEGKTARTVPFYKLQSHTQEKYHQLLEAYRQWNSLCTQFMWEATKAANWVAQVVRRDINPMFFAKDGKFLIVEGPFSDMSYRSSVPEYTSEEKNTLPESFLTSFEKQRETYEQLERKAWSID